MKKKKPIDLLEELKGLHDATLDHTYLDRLRSCRTCRIIEQVEREKRPKPRPQHGDTK
jgi:hypothetical protein